MQINTGVGVNSEKKWRLLLSLFLSPPSPPLSLSLSFSLSPVYQRVSVSKRGVNVISVHIYMATCVDMSGGEPMSIVFDIGRVSFVRLMLDIWRRQ